MGASIGLEACILHSAPLDRGARLESQMEADPGPLARTASLAADVRSGSRSVGVGQRPCPGQRGKELPGELAEVRGRPDGGYGGALPRRELRAGGPRRHRPRQGRDIPQPPDLTAYGARREIDIRFGREAAQTEAQGRLGELRIAPQRPQHVGGLARGGIAGRSCGYRQLRQAGDETLAFHALKGDAEESGQAGSLLAIEVDLAESLELVPETIAKPRQACRLH